MKKSLKIDRYKYKVQTALERFIVMSDRQGSC